MTNHEKNKRHEAIMSPLRVIPQSAMRACPHCIMVVEHYKADNSCRCDDKDHLEMAEWGYVWDGSTWVSPQEDDAA